MSKVALSGNALGTGTFTIASPNSNTDRTLSLPDASGTVQVSGNPISGTTGTFSEAISGTTASFSGNVTLGSSVLATPTGSAPSYTCRAWVNFNGTGAVTLRGAGNVSSVTWISTGTYRVNFTTAMPDTTFAVLVSGEAGSGAGNKYYGYPNVAGSATVFSYTGAGALVDTSIIEVAIVR